MKKITPWNKDAERLFDRIAKNGKAFTNDSHITRMLPRQYPDIFDKKNGLIGIYRSESRRESTIIPFDDVQIIPLPEPTSRTNEMRRKKFGIYRL